MRILAIRGCNLASLSAAFEVDFEREPLASAGLFAITGPTGAGKSTLLDALCLALYERTPRLERATARSEIPDVGDSAVTTSDPRTILRRGAAAGWAEVDFVGSDGTAYRSRWSVRRAHNKAGGRLQASEIRLTRLADGQTLGDHRKGETLRQIEAAIGLSFEQFTRAVLLAQNDFATFLKASDDDRAELLQTLTGTGTYARLSMQAHARMKAEREALERLQQQLQDGAPLQAQERAAREEELQQRRLALAGIEREQAEVERQRRWQRERDALAQQQADAQRQLDAALAGLEAAGPRRQALARLDAVEPARLLAAEVERCARLIAAEQRACQDGSAALEQARAGLAARQIERDAARQRLQDAERARAEAQPALEQARALDGLVAAALPRLDAARQADGQARVWLQQEQARAQAIARELERERGEKAAAGRWLASNEALRALAAGWPRWEALLGQAIALDAAGAQAQTRLDALQRQAADSADAIAAADAKLATLALRHEQALRAHEALAAQAAATDAEALARERAALGQRSERLREAAALLERLQRLRQQLAERSGEREIEQRKLLEAAQTLAAGEQERPRLDAELRAAQQAFEAAQRAASQDAVALRAGLQPDQPCPVCGSTAHPWAQDPVADAMLDSLRGLVQAKRDALDALQQAGASARAAADAASRRLEALEREQAALSAQISQTAQDWKSQPLRDELDAQPAAGRGDWLAAEIDRARERLDAIAQQEAGQRARLRERDAALQALERARAAVDAAREHRLRIERDADAARQSAASGRQQLAQTGQQLDALLGQLDAAFAESDWRDGWRSDPPGWLSTARAQALAWQQQSQQVQALDASIAVLQAQARGRGEALEQAQRQQSDLADALRRSGSELSELRQQRSALLNGETVDAALARLDAAIAAAKSGSQDAGERLRQAGEQASRLAEALRLGEERLARERDALAAARSRLQDWLAGFDARGHGALDADRLQQLLATDPGWIASERAALRQLEQQLDGLRAVLADRSASLARHQADHDLSADAAVLEQRLAELGRDAAQANEAIGRLRAELLHDDERLARSAELRTKIDAQAARTRTWSQLGELIGSADGKKFRNFAQQLTLDLLLGYANRHLQDLSRRYRIERQADSLGLLVVDQDMGDERRSVHSLSGGESFLLSLALALALASLSSHRVRVESLFIDEGFGSLDAESLNVAIDALDRLQAMGRKVGVISHVQELTERIGTRVRVRRASGGASRVSIEGR